MPRSRGCASCATWVSARIREKSRRQTARLVELADARGWRVNTPRDPDRRGGTVSVDMPGAQEVSTALLARDILVDWRPKAGVRMAPPFYTKDEELDDGDRSG